MKKVTQPFWISDQLSGKYHLKFLYCVRISWKGSQTIVQTKFRSNMILQNTICCYISIHSSTIYLLDIPHMSLDFDLSFKLVTSILAKIWKTLGEEVMFALSFGPGLESWILELDCSDCKETSVIYLLFTYLSFDVNLPICKMRSWIIQIAVPVSLINWINEESS